MISVAGREIGLNHRPYLIAEMSGNHNRSLDRAMAIVEAAASAGADAVKLQTYTAQTMTLPIHAPGFVIDDPASLWHGRQLYDLYDEAHTPWEWHAPLIDHARSLGMECFSTPFDDTAVDFLETLGVAAYKIASFECFDLPLIRKVSSTGKPMIISTGMAALSEIDQAVRTPRAAGCHQIVLLKCTSTYPATPENTNEVLAGIDWVLPPAKEYNIRVMNLSLAADSTDSWQTGPLARAVRSATAAGITVVVAAGNFGQTLTGAERYGTVRSPGHDPPVITVGSANTRGSALRSDDSVNFFSSRGPTRASFVNVNGVRRIDNLLKPDLVAPGNKVLGARSVDNFTLLFPSTLPAK